MKFLKLIFSSLLIIVLASCTSIVKKPDINNVKKVALVSVYGNQNIRELKQSGWARKSEVVTGFNDEQRQKVAELALNYYETKLKEMGTWKVMPVQQMLTSAKFSAAIKELRAVKDVSGKRIDENSLTGKLGNFLTNVAEMGYLTPAGMHPLPIPDENRNDNQRVIKSLIKLAKDLDVDAVAVVHIDLAYTGGTFSLGGTGTAVATVASSIKLVDKNGVVVVDYPDVTDKTKRFESETSSGMLQGKLIFNAKLETMLKEAIIASADNLVTEIKKEMQ